MAETAAKTSIMLQFYRLSIWVMADKILVTEYCNIKTTIIKIIVCGCETLENCLQWRNDILHLKFQSFMRMQE